MHGGAWLRWPESLRGRLCCCCTVCADIQCWLKVYVCVQAAVNALRNVLPVRFGGSLGCCVD